MLCLGRGHERLDALFRIFATSHVPTIHPVMAAKQAAAIDHISNGRFAHQHRHRLEPAGDRDVRLPA